MNRGGSGDLGQTAPPAIVYEVLRAPGQPINAETRAFFEPRFSESLDHVRVHTGTRAADSARAVMHAPIRSVIKSCSHRPDRAGNR